MADQRFLYTDEVVGANHPTKADTINRLALIEHNSDGSHKFPPTNLLPNSGFSVFSAAGEVAWGGPITVSSYSTGANLVICHSPDCATLHIGNNILATNCDTSLSVCSHTITSTGGSSFTFELQGNGVASGVGASTFTVHKAVPYSAPVWLNDYACDGFGINYWRKSTTTIMARVDIADVVLGPPSYYCMYVQKVESSAENIHFTWQKVDNYADVMRFAGRHMVFGSWVYGVTANSIRLSLTDGVNNYYSSYASTGIWNWLETTLTVGSYSTINQLSVFYNLAGASGVTAYLACPMLSFGYRLGVGNYQPIPNEVVHCIHHITPPHWNGANISEAKTRLRLEGESHCMIPKGAKALSLAFEGTCDSASEGECLIIARSSWADPITFGVIIHSQVANKMDYGGIALVQVKSSVQDSVYITKQGTGNWSLVSIDICAIWL